MHRNESLFIQFKSLKVVKRRKNVNCNHLERLRNFSKFSPILEGDMNWWQSEKMVTKSVKVIEIFWVLIYNSITTLEKKIKIWSDCIKTVFRNFMLTDKILIYFVICFYFCLQILTTIQSAKNSLFRWIQMSF